MSASQPSQGWLLQSECPVTHVGWQAPPALHVFAVTKAGDPVPVWHARPQAPHSALLLAKFTSQPSHGSMSQLARSVSQTGTHAPALHVFDSVPAGVWHARPHVPQFMPSVCKLTQTPLQRF